jgi:hypothetical protein
LLALVYSVNPLLIVYGSVHIVFALLSRLESTEVSWAPHFVSVELIWTSIFVSIFLSISASKECVSGFEAQLLVPTVLGGEVVTQECDPGVFMHH